MLAQDRLAASGSEKTTERSLYAAMAAITAIGLWVLPLRSSLWLDETGTYFIVKDGLHTAFAQSLKLGGTSPAYALVAWLMKSISPHNELVLRLPSVVAGALTAYLLFRLAKRLIGEEGAWVSVLIFVSSGLVAFAADDARPIALGMLCVVGASLCLCRWLSESNPWDAIGFLFLSALAIYFQYLLLLPLLAHIPYAVQSLKGRPRRKIVGVGGLVLLLMLAPAVPQLLAIFGRRGALALPDRVTFAGLFSAVVPWAVLVGLGAGLAIAPFVSGLRFRSPQVQRRPWTLISCWLILPPLAMFIAARFLGVRVFTARYFVMTVPALGLALGDFISRVKASGSRLILVTLVVFASAATSVSTKHLEPQIQSFTSAITHHPGLEWDLRDTTYAVNSVVTSESTPVLIDSGFAESRSAEWLLDPQKRRALLAQQSFYPMHGALSPVPFDVTRETLPYLEGLLDAQLRTNAEFVLVTRSPTSPIRLWLRARLSPERFQDRIYAQWGNYWVVRFERQA